MSQFEQRRRSIPPQDLEEEVGFRIAGFLKDVSAAIEDHGVHGFVAVVLDRNGSEVRFHVFNAGADRVTDPVSRVAAERIESCLAAGMGPSIRITDGESG